MVQITAAAVHQASDAVFPGGRGGHGATQHTGAMVQIDGFVAVLFDQALHIGRDDVVGFFPANALEFAFTARPDSFHRIFQAVRIVDTRRMERPHEQGAGADAS